MSDDCARKYKFSPRWKEELVCSCADGQLVLELSMGVAHAYFPTDEVWQARAPDWAKSRRAEILEALQAWCRRENVPLTVDPDSGVS